MNKAELIARVATSAKINKREATDALNSVINSIVANLGKGTMVKLSGFGTFSVVKRVSRKVLNPRTGNKITIRAKRVVKFKMGIQLAEKMGK
jgi:DNA-binding protein HU-beta